MSDLSDFRRKVYEPETKALRASNADLRKALQSQNEKMRKALQIAFSRMQSAYAHLNEKSGEATDLWIAMTEAQTALNALGGAE